MDTKTSLQEFLTNPCPKLFTIGSIPSQALCPLVKLGALLIKDSSLFKSSYSESSHKQTHLEEWVRMVLVSSSPLEE